MDRYFVLALTGSLMPIMLLVSSCSGQDVVHPTEAELKGKLARRGHHHDIKSLTASPDDELAAEVIRVCLEELAAVRALGEIGTSRAEREILGVLEDEGLAESALYILAKTGSELSVPVLVDTLKETKRSNLRLSIIARLGELGIDPAVEALLRELERNKGDRRVIEALGHTGDRQAIVPIRAILYFRLVSLD